MCAVVCSRFRVQCSYLTLAWKYRCPCIGDTSDTLAFPMLNIGTSLLLCLSMVERRSSISFLAIRTRLPVWYGFDILGYVFQISGGSRGYLAGGGCIPPPAKLNNVFVTFWWINFFHSFESLWFNNTSYSLRQGWRTCGPLKLWPACTYGSCNARLTISAYWTVKTCQNTVTQLKLRPADVMTFFCSSLDLGQKIELMRTCWLFFALH